jgi:hypothetical protein
LKKLDVTTPEILIASCSQIEETKAQLLHALWVLVANSIIVTDLTKKITMKSSIWYYK